MWKTLLLRRSPPKAAPASEIFFVTVEGKPVAATLKRSARARRFTLRVKQGGSDVVVTAPLWAKLADVCDFASRHADWIAARLKRAEARIAFAPGAMIPLRGVPHLIEHRDSARGVAWTEMTADGAPRLAVAGRLEHVERRVIDFLKAEARRDFAAAVARYTKALGKKHSRITIRDQTTRWGSCSSSGALSFSWRLILAPPFVLDYLAAHEVAHLKEMNHGPRFWRTLRALDPHMDHAKAWIRANGAGLHRYGLAIPRGVPVSDAD